MKENRMDHSKLTESDRAKIEAAYKKLTGISDIQVSLEIFGLDELLTFTRKTVADFDKARLNSWSAPGRRCEDEHAVYYWNAQTAGGRSRHDLAIVDCGDFRVVIE